MFYCIRINQPLNPRPDSMSPNRIPAEYQNKRTNPLYNLPGGLNSQPLLKKQYRPIATATGFPCFSLGFEDG